MIIERAEVLGYCMGVRRAVEAAERAVDEYCGKKIVTLGELIHNNSALKALAQKGVCVLQEDAFLQSNATGADGANAVNCTNASDVNAHNADNGTNANASNTNAPKQQVLDSNSVVIIRAHGVAPNVKDELAKKGCTIIDATCPRVLSSQKRAALYAQKGYTVYLAGDKNHGEILGISGYARANGADCIVVQNASDVELIAPTNAPGVLISQTTISQKEFNAIANALMQKVTSLCVCNTICTATQERQGALLDLCKKVDGVLVIGGKQSANTQRLLRSAKEHCANAALIETADEIPKNFFSLKRVGITAGASTPDFIIDEVESCLQN